jgi:hypothetical protein
MERSLRNAGRDADAVKQLIQSLCAVFDRQMKGLRRWSIVENQVSFYNLRNRNAFVASFSNKTRLNLWWQFKSDGHNHSPWFNYTLC